MVFYNIKTVNTAQKKNLPNWTIQAIFQQIAQWHLQVWSNMKWLNMCVCVCLWQNKCEIERDPRTKNVCVRKTENMCVLGCVPSGSLFSGTCFFSDPHSGWAQEESLAILVLSHCFLISNFHQMSKRKKAEGQITTLLWMTGLNYKEAWGQCKTVTCIWHWKIKDSLTFTDNVMWLANTDEFLLKQKKWQLIKSMKISIRMFWKLQTK